VSWRFPPIQSFIDRYVAKFAIFTMQATARFLPDNADQRERVDALREGELAAPDRSMRG
jgi:hypothetical protein